MGTQAPTKQCQASAPATLPTQTHQATAEEDHVPSLMQMEQTRLGGPCTVYGIFNIPYYSESCEVIKCLKYNSFLTTLVIAITVCQYAELRNAITI